jgi:hypothetical protein
MPLIQPIWCDLGRVVGVWRAGAAGLAAIVAAASGVVTGLVTADQSAGLWAAMAALAALAVSGAGLQAAVRSRTRRGLAQAHYG